MLKKTVLTFAFLTILTTFYGFNAKFSTPVTDDMLNEEADFGNSLLSDGDYVISAYDNICLLYTSVISGLKEYIVVDTDDVLMICPRSEEQNIKKFIDEVKFHNGDKHI